jgi:predicted RNA-binding Zn-ribbon protein involved in translation (DUF1610 family)
MAGPIATACTTCGKYDRFERLAPEGDVFACPDCGKKFRRSRSNGSADQLLDVLLLRADLKLNTRR